MTITDRPWTTLDNPVLRLRAVIVESRPDLFRADVVAGPGGNGGPLHVHREQEERFEVLEGALAYRLGRRRGILRPGDTLIVPPRTPHAFRNDTDGDARFVAEFRPALRVRAFFEELFALARDGHTDARGLPSPRVAARLMREYPAEFFYLPYVPVAAQRAIAALLR
jgi:quercetin dioxygenase-like cupin family protein